MPTAAANTSASTSARRTSTVVTLRVADLRVPTRLGLVLLGSDLLRERVARMYRRAGGGITSYLMAIVTGMLAS